MTVENFRFIDSLVTAYPDVSDGLVNGDDHIRGIKTTLKNTFPNVTGALTCTQTDLNTVARWASEGATTIKSAGVFFNANPTDGFKNIIAGDIDVVLQGTVTATFQRTAGVNFFKVNGGIQATGEIKGPGITPIGSAVMWFEDTLPTDGLWVWANGQVIANANTVCPVLLARWGSRFGGNGVTSMGVPDMREVVPVGSSTMGGTTAPGLLNSIGAAFRTTLASLFGSDTVTLSKAQVPPLSFSGTTGYCNQNASHYHSYLRAKFGGSADGGGMSWAYTEYTDTTAWADTNHTHNFSGTTDGGGGAHSNVQPSRVVNWIVRIG